MGLFDNWPYSDVHQLNLDWILKVIKEIKGKTDEIDGAVETAQQEAEAASQSEINAAGYRDEAEDYRDGAQEYYNQTLAIVTGSPKVVNLISNMTDTDLIYLYVGSEPGYTAGNWYYYDGNDWVDGGTYGATGMADNARNLLKYILDRVAYTEQGMDIYVEALYEALEQIQHVVTTYTITNALSNVTNSNSATGANAGSVYTATLSPDQDFNISSVSITMGGVNVTATVYDSVTKVINITNVTGDIVITAIATGSSILYQLPNPVTFTGVSGETVHTGFHPLSVERDYTVTVQFTRSTTVNNSSYILQCMEGSSPYWGVKLGINSNKYQAISNGVTNTTAFDDFNPAGTNILKAVLRHTANSNTVRWQMAGPSNNIYEANIGSSLKTINYELYLGGNLYVGSINKFVWYDRLLSDAEATAFLEDNS